MIGDTLDKLQPQTGWNSQSQLDLLLEFLEFHASKDLQKQCVRFLEERAQKESDF